MGKEAVLCTVENAAEADRIIALLESNEIPSYTRQYGPGRLFGSYNGFFGASGVEILVPEEVLDKAMELIDVKPE